MNVVNLMVVAVVATQHIVTLVVVRKGLSAVIVILSANVARGIAGWKKHVSQFVIYLLFLVHHHSQLNFLWLPLTVDCECGDAGVWFCG